MNSAPNPVFQSRHPSRQWLAALTTLLVSCSQLPNVPSLTPPPRDDTPPSLTAIALDTPAAFHGGQVSLSASATDNVGVTRYTFEVDGQVACEGPAATCSITLPAGAATEFAVTVTAVDAAKNAATLSRSFSYATATARKDGLKLTELGTNWLEVYNPLDQPQPLSGFQIRAYAKVDYTPHVFNLPDVVLPPHEYALIRRGKYVSGRYQTMPSSAHWIELADDTGSLIVSCIYGFAELLQQGKTVDFVSVGGDPVEPITPGTWARDQPAFAVQNSLALVGGRWIEVPFATPGGSNDVPATARDADTDGIPDTAEVPGGRFAGLDLYAMGVRTGVKDILIEVDAMASGDAAMDPEGRYFQEVVDAFAARNIAVHIDRGSRFSATVDPLHFNLGNAANTVPYSTLFTLSRQDGIPSSLADLKSRFFDPRRLPVFHYAIIGSRDPDGVYYTGTGELGGNDLILTVEGRLPSEVPGTFMHELGHNLGLNHGGDEELNFKPNYFSVMNYQYSCLKFDHTGSACPIGYSDGSSADLDENHLDEGAGIGREPFFSDWNKDGKQQDDVAVDLTGDKKLTVLHDYNDWGHLQLPFNTGYGTGLLSVSPRTTVISDDRQRTEH